MFYLYTASLRHATNIMTFVTYTKNRTLISDTIMKARLCCNE